jgi:hypothetical protein
MGNKAAIAGILSIVSGVFGLLYFALTMVAVYALRFAFDFIDEMNPFPPEMFTAMSVFYILFGVFFALLGVLGIVGGVYSIKKRYWPLALSAAIAGVITFFPTGVAATILVGMAQQEFE